MCIQANQVEQAIELWLEAQDYESLLFLYHHPGSLSLPDTLHPSISQHVLLQADLKGNQLKQQLSDFRVKYARLLVVQESKKHQPVEAGDMLQHDNDAMSE